MAFTESKNHKLLVRLVTKNEKNIQAILRIENDAFSGNSLNNWSLVPYIRYGHVFGVFSDNSIRGFAIYLKTWANPKQVYLVEIAVEKNSQGKGYGYYLLLSSLISLKKEGISIVCLTVSPSNTQAKHLYCDKLGFAVAEFRKDEYGPTLDREFLKLDLTNWKPNLQI